LYSNFHFSLRLIKTWKKMFLPLRNFSNLLIVGTDRFIEKKES